MHKPVEKMQIRPFEKQTSTNESQIEREIKLLPITVRGHPEIF